MTIREKLRLAAEMERLNRERVEDWKRKEAELGQRAIDEAGTARA